MTASDTTTPAVRRVRAYFAPVDRAAGAPAIFDPAQGGVFNLCEPPAPWVDLGWVDGFVRECGTKIEAVRAGAPGTVQTQVRSGVDASLSLRFQSWGKLQLALAAGSQQMNVLKAAGSSVAGPSGGMAVSATALGAGATATALPVGSAAGQFSAGELVAVDVDYTGQTGWVGAGVSGAYVRAALTDVDYVRRVTLNVARVSAVSHGVLELANALPAGAPSTAMKVSSVVGFCDREGSCFFQEWSGVFVAEGQQGERVIWYYPRLQSSAGAAEHVGTGAGGLQSYTLNGAFRALPIVDPLDGERVVCFRSYVAG